MEHLVLKVGVVDIDMCISSRLKEELACTADNEWLWVIVAIATI